MAEDYIYELWNGKRVVGYYNAGPLPLGGSYVIFYDTSTLKQPYGKTFKTTKVPVIYRKVSENRTDTTIRMCLDVKRKSARQIKMISNHG